MSKGYEERYLMTLLSAVMNKKAAPEPLRRLNWGKVFRLADYHHVAHAVYYGIMGLKEEIPQQIRQQFFDKYLEAVLRAERLRAGEKEVRALLERAKLNSFVLEYSEMVGCYPIEEMCCCGAIEIGLDRKSAFLLKSVLEDADFEEQRSDEERGRIYYRVPGIRLLSYDYSLFFSKSMRRYFKGLMSNQPFRKGFRYVRQLTVDDKYLFYMCRMTDSYARGEISLNQIVDFWAFYKKNAEFFSWPYIYDKLKALKIAEFAEKLENLILRWFGTGAAVENTEVYDAMESYILSKGSEGREISSQFLPLIKTVADCYARNRRAELFKKLLEWTFPDKRYMETIYPLLEHAGWLLPLFWLVRLGRYGIRFVWHGIKEKGKLLLGKIPFLNKIYKKRQKMNEMPEESETSEEAETPEVSVPSGTPQSSKRPHPSETVEYSGSQDAEEQSSGGEEGSGENRQEDKEGKEDKEKTAEIPK